MKYTSIERLDRFTLKCIREDGKSVEVPIEPGVDDSVFVEVSSIWAWDSPDCTNLTDEDKTELRASLAEYFSQQGLKAIFDSFDETRKDQAPSFSLKRLNANIVQCERGGKTALVSVAKTVDGSRQLIGIDRSHFWEPPDDQLELNDDDLRTLMTEMEGFLDDGKVRIEFQTEYIRPAAPAKATVEHVADGNDDDDSDEE